MKKLKDTKYTYANEYSITLIQQIKSVYDTDAVAQTWNKIDENSSEINIQFYVDVKESKEEINKQLSIIAANADCKLKSFNYNKIDPEEAEMGYDNYRDIDATFIVPSGIYSSAKKNQTKQKLNLVMQPTQNFSRCESCGEEFDETDLYPTKEGLLCKRCYKELKSMGYDLKYDSIEKEDEEEIEVENSDFDLDEGEWVEVRSKQVEDVTGFMTDYTWYTDGHKHIFMFGDNDLYEPDEFYADWVVEIYEGYEDEAYKEAEEWFDGYVGFAEENESSIDDSKKKPKMI